MNIENETLTALQRAKKRYYEKIRNTPEYIEKRNKNSNNYYHTKLKCNPEFKSRVSEMKRTYYQNKKKEILLEILI